MQYSCPNWVADTKTNVCMVCVYVRERVRVRQREPETEIQRDRLVHDQDISEYL